MPCFSTFQRIVQNGPPMVTTLSRTCFDAWGDAMGFAFVINRRSYRRFSRFGACLNLKLIPGLDIPRIQVRGFRP